MFNTTPTSYKNWLLKQNLYIKTFRHIFYIPMSKYNKVLLVTDNKSSLIWLYQNRTCISLCVHRIQLYNKSPILISKFYKIFYSIIHAMDKMVIIILFHKQISLDLSQNRQYWASKWLVTRISHIVVYYDKF